MNPPTIKIGGKDTVIYHGACVDCSSQWDNGTERCLGCYFCPLTNYATAKNLQIETKPHFVDYTDTQEIIDKIPAWEWLSNDPNILDYPDRIDLKKGILKMKTKLMERGIQI